jgi:hypothetical protein
MNRMSSVLILSLALSGSAAFADTRADKDKLLQIVSAECIVENGERTGNCPRISVKPRITLVSAEAPKTKRNRITQMPWMIGAFQ